MKKLLSLNTLLLLATFSFAQSKTFKPVYSTDAGAIQGYDPVAYFTEGKAVKGQADISLEWGGGAWHFASIAHRDSFQLKPEQYAPVYGGFCAFGWSRGYPAKTDPDAWSIVDGKLYLNYNADVKADWDKKRAYYIQKADANWLEASRK
jgi:YHS domain-containing protein